MTSRFIQLLTPVFFFNIAVSFAQNHQGSLYKDLYLAKDHISYKGKQIELDEKTFFIDGQLTDKEVSKYNFVYNSLNEASKHLTNGSEEEPMVLYIAPWVYWIDNPDDPEIRVPQENQSAPIGLEINCEWLKLVGLSNNPEHIVLASNRGQTMGAKGNFTMLSIKGDGTYAENITFGNYCNIDLVYPLHPKLNRKKRSTAIVQAQLVFSNGDKVFVKNSRFVSRLNLAPFWGSRRTLFEGCHFEMTDDALNGRAIYLDCTLDFYSSKPFYRTDGTGAVFLNCDIQIFNNDHQYFTKAGGQVAIIDTRFSSKDSVAIGWRDTPLLEARNYQQNLSLNNEPLFISENNAFATVELDKTDVLKAYKFEYQNKVIYNTYNLLRGDDDWDPLQIKNSVEQIENETGNNYALVATQLTIKPTRSQLETGKDSLMLHTSLNRFGNFDVKGSPIKWSISEEFKPYIQLKPNRDGSCWIIPTNTEDTTKQVIIKASTVSGLEAATVIYVSPSILPPPTLIKLPQIQKSSEGKLQVDYTLDTNYNDESLISWYRCEDSKGKNPIQITVSRFNEPLKTYELSEGDKGHYIMAKIAPKHLRSHAGNTETIVYPEIIDSNDVKSTPKVLIPNFKNMSAEYQPKIIPGFWTLDSYAPTDTNAYEWEANNRQAPWYFGEGVNGAKGLKGFVQNTKGARMRYTPVGNIFGDMRISFIAFPAKTAGQGFSSAKSQYMDIGIKMDTQNMTGYALRIIRTTKYSDAVDFVLMTYENGIASAISKPISTACFVSNCHISIEVKDGNLIVNAKNPSRPHGSKERPDVQNQVDLQTEIAATKFGGISIQHTGTVGSGATLIKDLKIEWF